MLQQRVGLVGIQRYWLDTVDVQCLFFNPDSSQAGGRGVRFPSPAPVLWKGGTDDQDVAKTDFENSVANTSAIRTVLTAVWIEFRGAVRIL